MRSILVADTTLFRVAAEHLGDATLWEAIARLNQISDPLIVGVLRLRLPDMLPTQVLDRASR